MRSVCLRIFVKGEKTIDIFLLLRYHMKVLTPGWCNGSTGDSGSSCLGSSPSPGAIFLNGAMVKRSRRRPLKAKSWVQFPLALPN